MEAPKLQLTPEERVTIPLLESDTWRRDPCAARPGTCPLA
jgi:hypothetical protein